MSTQAHPTNPDLAASVVPGGLPAGSQADQAGASGQSPGDPAALAAEVLTLRQERRQARDDLARLRRAVWAAVDLIDEALQCPDKLGRERRVRDARDGLERAAGREGQDNAD